MIHISPPYRRARFGRARRSARAFTFVEMMISAVLFLAIGIIVSYLIVVAARMTKDGFAKITTQSKARFSIEEIRRVVMPAEIGSVVVLDNGHTIRFTHYAKDMSTGELARNADGDFYLQTGEVAYKPLTYTYKDAEGATRSKTETLLYYKPDVTNTAANPTLYRGLSGATFALLNNGRILHVVVTATEMVSASEWGDVKSSTITLEDTIMFRNSSEP